MSLSRRTKSYIELLAVKKRDRLSPNNAISDARKRVLIKFTAKNAAATLRFVL